MVLLQFKCLQNISTNTQKKSNTEDEYVFQIITGKYLQRLVPIRALIFLLFCIFWIQKLPFFNLTREYQLKQGNLDSKLSP